MEFQLSSITGMILNADGIQSQDYVEFIEILCGLDSTKLSDGLFASLVS